jgi:hypothetical protein
MQFIAEMKFRLRFSYLKYFGVCCANKVGILIEKSLLEQTKTEIDEGQL